MIDATAPTRRQRLIVAIALCAFAALGVASIAGKSLTEDEVAHLPAGASYLRTGDFRLNPEHPPLLKMLAAIPVVLAGADVPLDHPSWEQAASSRDAQWVFGRVFFFERNRARLDELLLLGRLPMIALGVLLGWFVYRLARELFGTDVGVAAVALFAFSPTVLAHARLVTTDVGATAFATGSLWLLARFARTGGVPTVLGAGALAGLAIAGKYSSLLLLPTAAVLAGIALFSSRGPWRDRATVVDRLPRAARDAALFVVPALALPILSFGGDPAALFDGARSVFGNHDPGHRYYLLGHYSLDGFRSYYPVALALKTASPVLLLAAIGAWLAWRRRAGAPHPLAVAFVALPPVILLAIAAFNPHNIGVRHAIGVYPALFVLGGVSLAAAWTRDGAARAAAGLLVAWHVGGTAIAFPNYLPFVNESVALAGRDAADVLDDSNVEWGQDLRALGDFVRDRGIESIAVTVLAPTPPEIYGIPARRIHPRECFFPEPGWHAVGAHPLVRDRIYPVPGFRFHWHHRIDEVARVGGSIYVFRFRILDEGDRPLSDFEGTQLTRRAWHDQGIAWLRESLAASPDATEVAFLLATELCTAGRGAEAAAVLPIVERGALSRERALTVAALWLAAGRVADGLARLDRVATESPDHGPARRLQATHHVLAAARSSGTDAARHLATARDAFATAKRVGAVDDATFEVFRTRILRNANARSVPK